MRRSAQEVIRNLEGRIARLENKEAGNRFKEVKVEIEDAFSKISAPLRIEKNYEFNFTDDDGGWSEGNVIIWSQQYYHFDKIYFIVLHEEMGPGYDEHVVVDSLKTDLSSAKQRASTMLKEIENGTYRSK